MDVSSRVNLPDLATQAKEMLKVHRSHDMWAQAWETKSDPKDEQIGAKIDYKQMHHVVD